MTRPLVPTQPLIGVFDSGVGGLSIFQTIRDRLPGARYAYCSDNLNFPYGTRSEDEVVALTHAATSRFIARCSLDILIIACNTISTVALPRLRSTFAIPVVGVVPAIKPAAQMSRSHTIGLLATPGTVVRPYTDELVKSFASTCRVLRHGSSLFVELAERKLRGEALDLDQVRTELRPLFAQSPPEPAKRLDTVVLGCTHFPLLLPELRQTAPWEVQWIDSSEAIAARVDYLLTERGIDPRAAPVTEVRPEPPVAWFTRRDASAEALVGALRRLGFSGIDELS